MIRSLKFRSRARKLPGVEEDYVKKDRDDEEGKPGVLGQSWWRKSQMRKVCLESVD